MFFFHPFLYHSDLKIFWQFSAVSQFPSHSIIPSNLRLLPVTTINNPKQQWLPSSHWKHLFHYILMKETFIYFELFLPCHVTFPFVSISPLSSHSPSKWLIMVGFPKAFYIFHKLSITHLSEDFHWIFITFTVSLWVTHWDSLSLL